MKDMKFEIKGKDLALLDYPTIVIHNVREIAWTETSHSLGNTTGNYIILYSVIYFPLVI